jgi:hypothetical protein
MRRPWPSKGCCATGKESYKVFHVQYSDVTIIPLHAAGNSFVNIINSSAV